MKKLFALALAMAMTLSLAACGAKEQAPAASAAPAASSAPAASAAEPSTDPIVINISHSYTELDQVSVELNNAKAAIEERTNGVVTVNLFPNNTFGNMADGVEAVMSDSPLMLMAAYSQWRICTLTLLLCSAVSCSRPARSSWRSCRPSCSTRSWLRWIRPMSTPSTALSSVVCVTSSARSPTPLPLR